MTATQDIKLKNARTGFTFVELIIAIAILAILAVIVAPRLTRYLEDAKRNTTVTNLQTLKTAIDYYWSRVGKYPDSLLDLVRKPSNVPESKWGQPYLEKDEIPNDGWDNPFVYKITPKGAHPYDLYSYGKNGPGSPAEEWISAWK